MAETTSFPDELLEQKPQKEILPIAQELQIPITQQAIEIPEEDQHEVAVNELLDAMDNAKTQLGAVEIAVENLLYQNALQELVFAIKHLITARNFVADGVIEEEPEQAEKEVLKKLFEDIYSKITKKFFVLCCQVIVENKEDTFKTFTAAIREIVGVEGGIDYLREIRTIFQEKVFKVRKEPDKIAFFTLFSLELAGYVENVFEYSLIDQALEERSLPINNLSCIKTLADIIEKATNEYSKVAVNGMADEIKDIYIKSQMLLAKTYKINGSLIEALMYYEMVGEIDAFLAKIRGKEPNKEIAENILGLRKTLTFVQREELRETIASQEPPRKVARIM